MTHVEAARILRVSPRTVAMWCAKGRLASTKVVGEPEVVERTGYGPLGWSASRWTHTPATWHIDPEEVARFASEHGLEIL